jgi:hypothetical protein
MLTNIKSGARVPARGPAVEKHCRSLSTQRISERTVLRCTVHKTLRYRNSWIIQLLPFVYARSACLSHTVLHGLLQEDPQNHPPPAITQQPLGGEVLLVIDASRSHSDTPHNR